MGLWRLPGEWADYEWFDVTKVADQPTPRPPRRRGRRTGSSASGAKPNGAAVVLDDPGEAMGQWLVDHVRAAPLWDEGDSERILLVDLDNLRAAPSRLQARMAVVVELAREADHVALAGQAGAVRRSSPWLAEYADVVQAVPDGSDLADLALLAEAEAVTAPRVQFLVVSNDGIFAPLAERGPLALLSPGAEARSDRLRDVAHRAEDLAALEKQAVAERAKTRRQARKRVPPVATSP